MLIEIHMLKNYAPANLNRDDSGAPKTCMFGGVQRGRISSQCLKRSWRSSKWLRTAVGENYFGIRTRKMPELVGEILEKDGVEKEKLEAILPRLTGFGNREAKEVKDKLQTQQIIFYSQEELQGIANRVKAMIEGKATKEIKKIPGKEVQEYIIKNMEKCGITLDMALFGRMVTSNALADIEAAMQVAHAISTNRIMMENDYFTAVDDQIFGSEEESGSAMIGDVDFNSSCYYMYASIDTDILLHNLMNCEEREELIQKAIPALIETMAYTDPSGKQNGFASHPMPSAVLVECKDKKVAVSYANAFVKPARFGQQEDMLLDSIQKLKKEVECIDADFALPVEKRLWYCGSQYGVKLEAGAHNCKNFPELLNEVKV